MRISLTALTDHGPRDVVVTGDLETTVAGVASSLLATLSENPGPEGEQLAQVLQHPRARWSSGPAARHSPAHAAHALWTGGRLLDPTATASSTLRDGAVVAVDPRDAAGTVLAEPAGSFEIRVSGGPAAGAVHRVGIGTITLGTDDDVNVRLDDPAVPGRALRVTVEARRVTVEPLGGEPALEGVPLTGVAEWSPGDVVVTGTTVLTLSASTPPDARLSPLEDGGLAYHRPPRTLPADQCKQLELPQMPVNDGRQRLRLLCSALVAVAGIVMVAVTGQWYWALTALAYPIIQAGALINDRLHGRTSFTKALQEYHAKRDRFDTELERLRRADEAQRRAAAPDPAEVLLTVTGPRRRLWERRPDDPDALHLRFGLADLPSHIELFPAPRVGHRRSDIRAKDTAGTWDDPSAPPAPRSAPDATWRADELIPPIARTIPVRLPMPDLGVVGLAGPRDRSRALARWLVAQAAALHSPRDLAIVVLSADPDGGEHWNWVRWLPHCAPRQDEECLALVGTDSESVARRVTELAIRITERRRAESADGTGGFFPGAEDAAPSGRPYDILLVLDGARLLRRVPGMPQVLSKGPAVGLHAICIDDDERLLPEECRAVALWDWDRPTHVRLRGEGMETFGPVLAEQVSTAWCDRLARALAPVRDVSGEDADSGLPASVRLLDVLAMPDPTAEHILAAWSSAGRTTRAPIGVAADGVFSVDLRRDGPHILVAGAAGAGKPGLLRTLVVSLAVTNRPDEMVFALIDDEGGTTFEECAGLPHTIDSITGLDERTLDVLEAELRRREDLLLAADATDIEDYEGLRDAGDADAAGPLPRLVLVIGEFATTTGDLAAYVPELLDIGRRGRRLGIHLILATQRAASSVTAGIREETDLRIALRMADPEASIAVTEDVAAARIPESFESRCYVRSGTTTARAVQTARVDGRGPGAGPRARTLVQQVPWTALGRALPGVAAGGRESTTATDLAVLVAAIAAAARLGPQ